MNTTTDSKQAKIFPSWKAAADVVNGRAGLRVMQTPAGVVIGCEATTGQIFRFIAN